MNQQSYDSPAVTQIYNYAVNIYIFDVSNFHLLTVSGWGPGKTLRCQKSSAADDWTIYNELVSEEEAEIINDDDPKAAGYNIVTIEPK